MGEDLPRGRRCPPARELVFVFADPRVEERRVRDVDELRPESARCCDDELRADPVAGVRFFRDELGEGTRDRWASPFFFPGRTTDFCASSYALASAAVSNDLRLRTPLRSLQSARYFVPF